MNRSQKFHRTSLICFWQQFVVLAALALTSREALATAPLAATQPAMAITTSNAVLTGMVTPNATPTTVWFQWGPDTGYGNLTAPISAGSGNGVVRVTTAISGLAPWRAFHFQLVASNVDGIIYGADQTLSVGKVVWVWGNNYSNQTNVPVTFSNAVLLAGGGVHSLGLDTDGNVTAWGNDLYGQTDVPPALANATVSIGAGYYHSLALKNNGRVTAWGNNIYKQCNVPAGLAGVVAVAGGYYHSLALTASGQVVAWGQNSFGQTNVPTAASNIVAIAAGGDHNLALRNDGVIIGWGDNSAGQINIPPGLTGVVALSAGGLHSMALLSDGTVVAWGDSSAGQTSIPGGLAGVVAIAAGENHCEAIKSDGTSVGWGYDFYGQTDAPVAATNLIAIAAGGDKSMALGLDTAPAATLQTVFGIANNPLVIQLTGTDRENDPLTFKVYQLPPVGTLYQYDPNTTFGAPILAGNTPVTDAGGRVVFLSATNDFGIPYTSFQFVANDGGYDSSPTNININMGGPPLAKTEVPGPVGLTTATLRGMATANYTSSRAWFEWGTNTAYGNTTALQTVGTNLNVVFLSRNIAGLVATVPYHCRFVVSNLAGVAYGTDQIFGVGKKTWAWGDNSLQQISVAPSATNAVGLAAGSGHSLAILPNGTGVGWGDSGAGQATVDPALNNIIQLAGGDFHSLALLADGTVRAFGDNTYGQTNIPALTKVISVAAGSYHNLALRTNGLVTAWGANGGGQATVPAGLNNVVAVSAGFAHSMALKNNGTIVCWGDNTYGQTNVPPGTTNILAIAAGANYCLALKNDGTISAWGDNSASQISIPANATNVVALAAGGSHCLALRRDGTLVAWGFNGNGQTVVPAGATNIILLAAGLNHSLAVSANNPPMAIPQTITSPQVTELPITLSGFDPDGDSMTSIVTGLPNFGQLYQNNGGARGVAILRTNTVVTDAGGQVIFVPDPGAHGAPYATFQFAVSDGIYTSTSAPVTINIVGPPPATNNVPTAPFAATQMPSLITSSNATLNGMATANFTPTIAWFEWGTSTNYGKRTPIVTLATNNGVSRVSLTISNLIATIPYHFRIVASNQVAVVGGADQVFGVGKVVLAWGDNTFQQTNVPPTLTNSAVSISSGYFHTMAVKTDGSGVAWGDNGSGQTSLPSSGASLVQLTGGDLHTLALFADGTVAAVGDNTYGQTSVPASLGGAIAIASGGYHNLALTTNGTVVAWGANNAGQINVPGANNIVAVAAGFAHSMALRNDGALLIWGDNTYGQQNIPASATNITAIAAGRNFCLALRSDGTLVGWGDNAANQITIPAGATNVVAVAAGNSHSVALREDGRIVAWGLNNYGQVTITNALTNNNFIAVTAGEYHSMAMSADNPPSAGNQIIFNAPTNNLIVITLSGTDPDAADTNSLTFRIVSIPALGTLYQFNPATSNRGPAILTTNVLVTDASGRVVFGPNPGGYGAPYASFQFLANDRVYDSAPATVVINIPGKPTVTTLLPALFNRTNITLNGLISPNLSNSIAFFQWGLTTNYGSNTLATNIAGATPSAAVFTNILNLLTATNYHYRIVGSNSFGTNVGADMTFIVPVAPYFLTNSVVTNAGATFQFKFTGSSNATYSVWASTNLATWTKLGSATQPTPGNFIYQDLAVTNYPQRFYKVIWP